MSKKTKIVFQKDETLKMYDLSLFLKYFNILYLRLKEDGVQITSKKFDVDNFIFEKDSKKYSYYEQKLIKTDNDLVIYELDKHSPLELVVNLDSDMIVTIFAIIKLNVSLNINVNINVDLDLNAIIKKMKDILGNDNI